MKATDTTLTVRNPPWGWLALGAVAWVAAYASLLPLADAVVDLLGLTRHTHS